MEKQDEESESEEEEEEEDEVLTLLPVRSVFITCMSITGQCTPLFKFGDGEIKNKKVSYAHQGCIILL